MSATIDIPSAKARLRREISAAIKQLSTEEMSWSSKALCETLAELDIWKRADSVLLYAPMPGELDVWPLAHTALVQGKVLGLPRFNRNSHSYDVFCVSDLEREIVTGYFGIREPAAHCSAPSSNVLDLALVPGVAFDLSGRRLGRGKGYYDRLLTAWRGFACGVCFDEQIVEAIPVAPHDVQLNCILTPTRFFQPGRH